MTQLAETQLQLLIERRDEQQPRERRPTIHISPYKDGENVEDF